ncbi:hypothetical protein WA158_004396 [Blastocystis sp. Blastoise]
MNLILFLFLLHIGLFYYFESDTFFMETGSHLTMMDSIYAVFISMTTVGYGDITPKTTAGRFSMMALILSFAIFFANETGKFASIWSHRSSPFDSRILRTQSKHVILCGDLTFHSIQRFLKEFYDERYLNNTISTHIIIPTGMQDIKDELWYKQYSKRKIKLMLSSLIHAGFQDAKAVFIVGNLNQDHSLYDRDMFLRLNSLEQLARLCSSFRTTYEENSDEIDMKMKQCFHHSTLFDQTHLSFSSSYYPPVYYIQHHFHDVSYNPSSILSYHAIYLSVIKSILLAREVIFPGLWPLLHNLFLNTEHLTAHHKSMNLAVEGDSDDNIDMYSNVPLSPRSTIINSLLECQTGISLYIQNNETQIYTICLDDHFHDVYFQNFVFYAYYKYQVLPFALLYKKATKEFDSYGNRVFTEQIYINPKGMKVTLMKTKKQMKEDQKILNNRGSMNTLENEDEIYIFVISKDGKDIQNLVADTSYYKDLNVNLTQLNVLRNSQNCQIPSKSPSSILLPQLFDNNKWIEFFNKHNIDNGKKKKKLTLSNPEFYKNIVDTTINVSKNILYNSSKGEEITIFNDTNEESDIEKMKNTKTQLIDIACCQFGFQSMQTVLEDYHMENSSRHNSILPRDQCDNRNGIPTTIQLDRSNVQSEIVSHNNAINTISSPIPINNDNKDNNTNNNNTTTTTNNNTTTSTNINKSLDTRSLKGHIIICGENPSLVSLLFALNLTPYTSPLYQHDCVSSEDSRPMINVVLLTLSPKQQFPEFKNLNIIYVYGCSYYIHELITVNSTFAARIIIFPQPLSYWNNSSYMHLSQNNNDTDNSTDIESKEEEEQNNHGYVEEVNEAIEKEGLNDNDISVALTLYAVKKCYYDTLLKESSGFSGTQNELKSDELWTIGQAIQQMTASFKNSNIMDDKGIFPKDDILFTLQVICHVTNPSVIHSVLPYPSPMLISSYQEYFATIPFMTGSIFLDNAFSQFPVKVFNNPYLLRLLLLLLTGQDSFSSSSFANFLEKSGDYTQEEHYNHNSPLQTLIIPDDFKPRTFLCLFYQLYIQYGIIILGIRRNEEPPSIPFPFVLPPITLIVKPLYMLYVLYPYQMN